MSTFSSVDTVKSILKNVTYQGENFNEKQINLLMKLKTGDEQMFSLKDRNFILEALGLINNFGFEESYQFLKDQQKEKMRYNIIKKSKAFRPARRRFFLETTKELRTVKIDSYVSCPKCKLNEVSSVTEQKRSADEAATTTYTCTNCNHIWTSS